MPQTHKDSISSSCFADDENTLWFGSMDRTLSVWKKFHLKGALPAPLDFATAARVARHTQSQPRLILQPPAVHTSAEHPDSASGSPKASSQPKLSGSTTSAASSRQLHRFSLMGPLLSAASNAASVYSPPTSPHLTSSTDSLSPHSPSESPRDADLSDFIAKNKSPSSPRIFLKPSPTPSPSTSSNSLAIPSSNSLTLSTSGQSLNQNSPNVGIREVCKAYLMLITVI